MPRAWSSSLPHTTPPTPQNLSQVTTGIIIAASIAYFAVMLTNSKVDAVERTRVRAFIPLFIANAVFWSLSQQILSRFSRSIPMSG